MKNVALCSPIPYLSQQKKKNQVLGFTHYRPCVFLQNLRYASRSLIISKLLCCLNAVVWMQNGISFEDLQFANGVWRKLWNHTNLFCCSAFFFLYSISISKISLNGQHSKLSESANIKFLLIKLIYNVTYLFLLRSSYIFQCCLINILSPHLLNQLQTVNKRKYFKMFWLYLLNPPSLFNWIHNVFFVNNWQSSEPCNSQR